MPKNASPRAMNPTVTVAGGLLQVKVKCEWPRETRRPRTKLANSFWAKKLLWVKSLKADELYIHIPFIEPLLMSRLSLSLLLPLRLPRTSNRSTRTFSKLN